VNDVLLFWGEVFQQERFSPEEIRHNDSKSSGGELIAELLGIWVESKDIVDANEKSFGIWSSCLVDFKAVDRRTFDGGAYRDVIGLHWRESATR